MEDKHIKSKIAARFRTINILFLIFVLIVVISLGAVLILGISDSASKSYADFYSVEAREILGSYLNKELPLVQHAARSRELLDWFADEANQEKKSMAYNKLMEYADFLQIGSLYFGIQGSLNEYSVNSGARFEDFAPFDVLDPASIHDQWYFECINSKNDYSLNMDVDKISKIRRLWINHKVVENGTILGVFCSAFQFDAVFNDLFGDHDRRSVVGFVIDENGIIQIDSFASGAFTVYDDIEQFDLEEERHITDFNTDPVFVSTIQTCLESIDGHFSRRSDPLVIKISGGAYRYVSIIPILDTSWLAVTFFNARSLFNMGRVMLPFLVILSSFILYAIISTELVRRLVFKPLNLFTCSVSEADVGSNDIYGAGRDDEIGELAQTTQKTWNRLTEYNASLLASMRERERQSGILHAANTMAAVLLGAENESVFKAAALPEGIRLIADCMDVDHVIIWQNRTGTDDLFFPMYEWVSAGKQDRNFLSLDETFSYSKDIPEWHTAFLRGECISASAAAVDGTARTWLDMLNIKSVLAVPVHLHGVFWGFISFDICREERVLLQDEIDILRSGSLIIVSAINRNIQAAALQRRDQLLQTVNQAAAVLLDSNVSDFENSLYRCMGMMAGTVKTDRVYIWKNHIHEGELCASQIYEWSENAKPQQGNEYTINISYRENMPEWEEILSKGQCINSLVRDLSPGSRNQLAPQGIRSIFVAPVFLQEMFWGFVGFDDCHRERIFSENEVSILRSGCLLIANAFLHHNDIANIVRLQSDLRVALNEAQAASRAKSNFLANMSHEIRTPMNSIMGFSELALDSEASPKTKDYLSKILENAEWLLQIINDILDISKIESGKMELENIPFDMSELFASCRTLIMPKAVEKGIKLHFYAEPCMGKIPMGDPTRLRQVLVNLLANAVKFTNSGVVELHAEIVEQGKDTITMHFDVMDSGIGMTSEQMEKIFEPFTQAESGTTRKYGGTGLGLPITKNFVDIMGGALTVSSKPGDGSKFSFELTFNTMDVTNEEMFRKKLIFDELEKPMFNGEILLCEDNAMNQQVICEHLARVGLSTVIAENGKIGVELVQSRKEKGEKQFDLIFMDMHMPVMDGLEAAGKIAALETGVPVVAMTANIMSGDREIYKTSGMNDCVGKPFSSQELWRCLLKYFDPVDTDAAAKKAQLEDDSEFQKSLQKIFAKGNRNKYDEITNALESGDITLAHRLAHTLKSNAGQIGKILLQRAAADVEYNLKDGINLITLGQMVVLETELNTVLAELEPLLNESFKPAAEIQGEPLSAEAAIELIDKLMPMLEMGDYNCRDLINSLGRIPGTDVLIQQIDDLDFEHAAITLATLRRKLK